MGRSAHSDLTRRLREAHAACEESAATGVPIDEVADIRAGRRVCQRRTACEVVETYNDAAQRVLEREAPEDHLAKWVAMENVKRVGRREFLTGAAKAGVGVAALALVGVMLAARASGGRHEAADHSHRGRWSRGTPLRAHALRAEGLDLDHLRGHLRYWRALRDPAQLLEERPDRGDARGVHLL